MAQTITTPTADNVIEPIALKGTIKVLERARRMLVEAGYPDDEHWNDLFAEWDIDSYLHLEESLIYYNREYDAETILMVTVKNVEFVSQFLIDKLLK